MAGTPLWEAAYRGHEAVVKMLLENGADVESKDRLRTRRRSCGLQRRDMRRL